jgi:hypothetical protein
MKEKRSHGKDVTGRSRARDVALDGYIEDLCGGQNAVQVTRRDYVQRTAIVVGCIEVNPKR